MPSPSPARRYTPPPVPDFFVQAPVSVVRCRTLTPTEKTTYEVLLSYADADGVARPGQARLAAEVGVSAPTVRAALRALAAAGLIIPRRRGQGLTNSYQVLRVPLRGPSTERKPLSIKNAKPRRSKTQTTCVESNRTEQESGKQDQPPLTPAERPETGGGELAAEWSELITADAALISEAVGMDPADATLVAQQAAAQNQPPGYIAELVAHVTSSAGVQNPAGCLRALVRQGKHRPPRGPGSVPPRSARPLLHPEHYRPGGSMPIFSTRRKSADPRPVRHSPARPLHPLLKRGAVAPRPSPSRLIPCWRAGAGGMAARAAAAWTVGRQPVGAVATLIDITITRNLRIVAAALSSGIDPAVDSGYAATPQIGAGSAGCPKGRGGGADSAGWNAATNAASVPRREPRQQPRGQQRQPAGSRQTRPAAQPRRPMPNNPLPQCSPTLAPCVASFALAARPAPYPFHERGKESLH